MKLDLSKIEAASKRGDDEYDVFTDPEEVAARRGLIVVFPEDNQLQIDIDSEEQYEEFNRRFASFDFFYKAQITVTPSASGLPNRHVTITHPTETFETVERMMWQAALNDDPVRVFLNALRHADGQENPCRFFEVPEPLK